LEGKHGRKPRIPVKPTFPKRARRLRKRKVRREKGTNHGSNMQQDVEKGEEKKKRRD